jgi:hypothetical protein
MVRGNAVPGQLVTFVGSGFRPNSIVQARWDQASTRLRLISVNSRGGFAAQVRIPSGSLVGTHAVSLASVSTSWIQQTGGVHSTRLIPATPFLRVKVSVSGAPATLTPAPLIARCGGSLQARIDATPTNGTLDLSGCDYRVSSGVTISRAMSVKGGSVTAFTSALLITTSGVTISGMTVRGPRFDINSDHHGIDVRGSSASSYISNVTLSGNTITGWDGEAIHARFVDGFTFDNNVIADIYYAGIEGYSVKNGRISGNQIRDVIGTGNAYGIVLTRAYGGGLSQNPRSSDVVVSGNTIEDVRNWHGLDTHAGQRIQFVDNVVRRCLYGIFVTSSTDGGSTELFAPLDITVQGNTVESGVNDGSRSIGINFGGADSDSGAPGSSNELATGVISGNTITGYGTESNGDNAAIQVYDTSGLLVTSNTIIEASPTAISVYYNNYDFDISGNTIRDPWSNTVPWKGAYGIFVHVDYNTGTISENTFHRGTKMAAYVLTNNVVVKDYPHNQVTVR